MLHVENRTIILRSSLTYNTGTQYTLETTNSLHGSDVEDIHLKDTLKHSINRGQNMSYRIR